MECTRIQELLITDYIDGEASAQAQQQIKAHLASCPQCRAFEQALRQKAVAPFEHLEPAHPPESVWEQIRESIAGEPEPQPAVPLLERLRDFLRSGLFLRRPAFALATAFSLMLLFFVLARGPELRQVAVNEYLQEKSSLLLSLNGPVNGDLDQYLDFGTGIEQAFF